MRLESPEVKDRARCPMGSTSGKLRALTLAAAAPLILGCGEEKSWSPGEVESTCRVVVTPSPIRQGPVELEVTLPSTFHPEDRFGKRLRHEARPRSDPSAIQSGDAIEDRDIAHLFRFKLDVDRAGDWDIHLVATWRDGRVFCVESVVLHAVP